jgi:iron(III) transport system ATP-binding protein
MVPIHIRHLQKQFGSNVVLRDVSLTIEPGELFFLLGPSGCGKTTLLRHIAGFYTPDAGQLTFGDRDMTHVPPHQRNAAMMFQSYALWPHMTVEKNVAFGLEERRLPQEEIDARVDEALALVKLDRFHDSKVTQLSGGQQQRVALARALVVKPDILLLDEPLSNLDTKLRLEMRLEIRRLCKATGLTAVYVTHDQKEALSVADRLAVMNEGSIVQVGTPQEMYRQPQTLFAAQFMGETNLIEGHVERGTSRSYLWSVQTPTGRFWGRPTEPGWEPQIGDKVTVCARPEAFRFEKYPESRNCLTGTMASATYLGEHAQYEIHHETLGSHFLLETNPRVLHDASESHQVHIVCDPEDTVLLRH